MNEWKRQHPAAIFISFLNNLKQLLVSLIAILIFGQSSQAISPMFYWSFFIVLLLFSIANGFVGWWRFKYHLKSEELQITQGLIFRKNRFIRKDRIQSIDINAKLLQRMFGLVEVKIETAGGGSEPEFRIIALKKEEAASIKKQLLDKKLKTALNDFDQLNGLHCKDLEENEEISLNFMEEDPFSLEEQNVDKNFYQFEEETEEIEISDEDKEPDFQWRLGAQRLIFAALTSSGVGIAATFIAAIVSQAPQFLPSWLFDQIVGWFIHSSIMLIGSIIVFILFVAWIFTLTGTMLKYGYFTLKKQENEIHISRGVLEQRQLTLDANRITAVRIIQSPIRQLFDFVSIYVESAGGGTKEEDLSTILIPICKKREVKSILEEFVPEFAFTPNYQGLPKESLRRYMIKLMVPALVIAAVSTYYLSYGWLAFLLPIFGGVVGYFQYRSAGIDHQNDFLCIKSRVFSKTEVYVPRKRIQAMEFTQTVFQKLNDLYTIHVSVLTSIIGKTFSLRHISKTQMANEDQWYSYEEELKNREEKTSVNHQ